MMIWDLAVCFKRCALKYNMITKYLGLSLTSIKSTPFPKKDGFVGVFALSTILLSIGQYFFQTNSGVPFVFQSF